MRRNFLAAIVLAFVELACAAAQAQRIQFPAANGLRPIDGNVMPSTGAPVMVPINPATQSGIYPSTGFGSQTFDPYAGGSAFGAPPAILPQSGMLGAPIGGGYPANNYPAYTGPSPTLPGAGQSAIVGSYQNNPTNYGQPGVYPNSSPSALFPGSYGANPYGAQSSGLFGGFFRNMYNGMFGSPSGNYGGYTAPTVIQPNYNGGVYPPAYNSGTNWGGLNPQGSVFGANASYPPFIRLFQGVRFRHAYVHGNNDADALMINDSDVSLAFAIPNFLYSTQPLYLMPSFSLHQWDGPKPPSAADLPALAYSAFLDAGWQSDPARILGAELGARVGMFSDFDTAISDSLRIQGRAIGRVRLTPRATLKLGVLYLDRNKVKLLPAGGILWQPNQDTRFDLFFPEPKLSHYLSTVGNTDTWWYVGGYYGGGAWTVTRQDNSTDSIDINDLRLVLGLEWGRNEQMREGRRTGFLEVGYVFDRELLYDKMPLDNLDLQDTVMVRAGFGY